MVIGLVIGVVCVYSRKTGQESVLTGDIEMEKVVDNNVEEVAHLDKNTGSAKEDKKDDSNGSRAKENNYVEFNIGEPGEPPNIVFE